MQVLWAGEPAAGLLPQRPHGSAMGIAVVICDDHPAFVRGLEMLLAQDAPDIVVTGTATCADQVVELVEASPPDVLLLDIRMPGDDGITAIRRILGRSPTTRIIMLTASDEEADVAASLRGGASGYITKDADIADIVSAVRSVNQGQLVIPASLAGQLLDGRGDGQRPALTPLERDILAAIARGETNQDIANRLQMSDRSVRRRIANVYAKVHVADRLQAAVYAAELGLGDTQGRGR